MEFHLGDLFWGRGVSFCYVWHGRRRQRQQQPAGRLQLAQAQQQRLWQPAQHAVAVQCLVDTVAGHKQGLCMAAAVSCNSGHPIQQKVCGTFFV